MKLLKHNISNATSDKIWPHCVLCADTLCAPARGHVTPKMLHINFAPASILYDLSSKIPLRTPNKRKGIMSPPSAMAVKFRWGQLEPCYRATSCWVTIHFDDCYLGSWILNFFAYLGQKVRFLNESNFSQGISWITYFKINTVLTRVKERETFKVKLHTPNEIPE